MNWLIFLASWLWFVHMVCVCLCVQGKNWSTFWWPTLKREDLWSRRRRRLFVFARRSCGTSKLSLRTKFSRKWWSWLSWTCYLYASARDFLDRGSFVWLSVCRLLGCADRISWRRKSRGLWRWHSTYSLIASICEFDDRMEGVKGKWGMLYVGIALSCRGDL